MVYSFDSKEFIIIVPEAKNLSPELKDLIKRILFPADKRIGIE